MEDNLYDVLKHCTKLALSALYLRFYVRFCVPADVPVKGTFWDQKCVQYTLLPDGIIYIYIHMYGYICHKTPSAWLLAIAA